MKVATVSEMRELDQAAIKEFGIKDELLMENAGEAVWFVIHRHMDTAGKRFAVFCGGGNNGGDGFVIARKLHSNGARVTVFLLGDPAKFRGAAKLNWDIASGLPLEIKRLRDTRPVSRDLAHADAVVDALFGTGLQRDVEGLYRRVIERINRSSRPVFSVDIPSGIHGDTGRVMGVAVKADVTVTFGLPKLGNILYPGYEHCGRLYTTHISFPPSLYEDRIQVAISDPPLLPPRAREGHKGTFGQVLFVAGASSYFGAPYFSALSFMKAGGGYSRLAAPASMTPFIADKGSEIVFVPQKETPGGSIALENRSALLELAEQMDMVVVGPGLSLDHETQQLVRSLTAEIRKPLLIDGDGITALCDALDVIRSREGETVLTPHPGEMARITRIPANQIIGDRVGTLQRSTADLNAFIVLKGGRSLIGFPDGRVFINTSGNPGMATAGSGDVLAGTVPAMFGLGLPLPDAVCKGVFVHGLAGDLAAETEGEDGMTAQDILDYLPLAVKMDRAGLDEDLARRYRAVEVL